MWIGEQQLDVLEIWLPFDGAKKQIDSVPLRNRFLRERRDLLRPKPRANRLQRLRPIVPPP